LRYEANRYEGIAQTIPENLEKMLMKKNQQNKWKRDFLTIAGGQTLSLIGSALLVLPQKVDKAGKNTS
jgi:hypothetical protein